MLLVGQQNGLGTGGFACHGSLLELHLSATRNGACGPPPCTMGTWTRQTSSSLDVAINCSLRTAASAERRDGPYSHAMGRLQTTQLGSSMQRYTPLNYNFHEADDTTLF